MADRPIFSWRIVGAAMLLSLPFIAVSLDKGGDDPSVLNAEPMPKAGRSLLLDIARTDAGYVVMTASSWVPPMPVKPGNGSALNLGRPIVNP